MKNLYGKSLSTTFFALDESKWNISVSSTFFIEIVNFFVKFPL